VIRKSVWAILAAIVIAASAAAAHRVSAGAAPAISSGPTVTESVFHSFCSEHDSTTGACLDGETPGVMILGSDGNFYGTTPSAFPSGGTTFQLTPSGTLTTLHTFCPGKDPNRLQCPDGAGPGALIEGSDGNFYGTATVGGVNADHSGGSAGTLYSITPSGALTTLYSFCSQVDPVTKNCLDGEIPDGLIEANDGNFYGTTFEGGANSFVPAGTIFKITPGGVLTTLYSFCSRLDPGTLTCLDGQAPSGLIQGSDGNFYGVTSEDGQFGRPDVGGGTVFKITPSGAFTSLYSFCSRQEPNSVFCLDGNTPASVIEGRDGNFYGTTFFGGAHNDGTVFKLTPAGALTTLYSFCSRGDANIHDCLDGVDPNGLIEGSDGNFYGTTSAGGPFATATAAGTAFMITPGGTLTTLYPFCSQVASNFTNCLDGAEPAAPLIQDSEGNFYGVTAIGGGIGDFGFGTAFKLSVSFPMPVSAALAISPARRSFGKKVINSTNHESFTATAHSHNASQVVLGSFTISGSDYLIDPTLTTCKQGQTLQPNQQCTIVVDFTPLKVTAGLSDTGSLIVTSNAEKVSPKHGIVKFVGGGKNFPNGR
jgi:uncharacterized repeat protein (TIGR03803 family)